MNASDKLDYVLGQLEGPAREQADSEVSGDPQLAEALDRLSRAVHRLLEDELTIEVPAQLAGRTHAFVAEHGRRRSLLEFVPLTVPFRWADVAVAASIFLAGLLTLVPAMQRSKERMAQAGCGFNLQQLGVGLAQYAGLHHQYPYAPPDQPDAVAGSFAERLQDSGMLPDLKTLDCPCNGACAMASPTLHVPSLEHVRKRSPELYRRLLSCDYAYHVGFRNRAGRAGPVPANLTARVPLLADQPNHLRNHILAGNSPNHGGRGQNVLFSDGHVSWYTTRQVSPVDLDVYLNEDHRPAPGFSVDDSALVPSLFPFLGR
jgi:prepilin-type processing-associated H-X9-DG protein